MHLHAKILVCVCVCFFLSPACPSPHLFLNVRVQVDIPQWTCTDPAGNGNWHSFAETYLDTASPNAELAVSIESPGITVYPAIRDGAMVVDNRTAVATPISYTGGAGRTAELYAQHVTMGRTAELHAQHVTMGCAHMQ